MTTMKAAVWEDEMSLAVKELPVPEVPEGFSLIKVAYAGLCGTDFAIHHGRHPRAQHGLVMGHEMCGWLCDENGEVTEDSKLVVAEPLITCGDCRPCREGVSHVCQQLGLYGIDQPGALADYVAVPTDILYTIDKKIDPSVAALVEPLAVAVHAVAMSKLSKGDTIAVLGAGPIGILTSLVARYSGAERVIVSEPTAARRELAAELGFEIVPEGADAIEYVNEQTDGVGADLVFDTAGHPAVAPQLTPICRIRGQIVIVGVHKTPAAIDLRDVCFKEQEMVGVRVYTHDDFAKAVELINEDALKLGALPVKIFPLSDVTGAFEAAEFGTDCVKVLVTPKEN